MGVSVRRSLNTCSFAKAAPGLGFRTWRSYFKLGGGPLGYQFALARRRASPPHFLPRPCGHSAILQGGVEDLGVESRNLLMTGLGEGDSCNFKEMLKN